MLAHKHRLFWQALVCREGFLKDVALRLTWAGDLDSDL